MHPVPCWTHATWVDHPFTWLDSKLLMQVKSPYDFYADGQPCQLTATGVKVLTPAKGCPCGGAQ